MGCRPSLASRRACVFVAALSLVGCARGPTLTRTIQPPSLLPLRTFPLVWVASADQPDALRLADSIVSALNRGAQARARRISLTSLEPARAAGRIPAATAVLRLVTSFEERMDSRFTEHPQTVCGPYGCYQESRVTEYEVPVLRLRLEVVVHDGPSARELARFALSAEEEGREYAVLRQRAVTQLSRRLIEMIDPPARILHTRLLRLTNPAVERALRLANEGELPRARAELERLVASASFASFEPGRRSAALYDLAQLLRFDPEAPADANARARRLLERAVRLSPRRRYDRALRELAEDERRAATLEAQRAAASHNFALGRGEAPGAATPPTPPAGYR